MIGKRHFKERWLAVGFAAAALVLGPPAHAQEPGRVMIDVSSCVDLEKPGERLDCFERQLEAQRRLEAQRQAAPAASRTEQAPAAPAPAARTAPAPVTPAPAPAREAAPTATPTPSAVETIRGPRRRQQEAEAPAREILAVVTDLRETVPNTWLITLDNGQIWKQAPPKFYPLRRGTQVRL
jgi:hypothetical protein